MFSKVFNKIKQKVFSTKETLERLDGQDKDELHKQLDKNIIEFDNVTMIKRDQNMFDGGEITNVKIQKIDAGLGLGALVRFKSGKRFLSPLTDQMVRGFNPELAIYIDSADDKKAVIQIQQKKASAGHKGQGIVHTKIVRSFDVTNSSASFEKIKQLQKWMKLLKSGVGAKIYDIKNLAETREHSGNYTIEFDETPLPPAAAAVDNEEEHKEPEITSGASSTSGTEPDNNPEDGNTDGSDADPAPTAEPAKKEPLSLRERMRNLAGNKGALMANVMTTGPPPAPKEATEKRRLAANDSMENVFTIMWILPLLVIFVFWFKRYIVTKNNDDIVEDNVEDENALNNMV